MSRTLLSLHKPSADKLVAKMSAVADHILSDLRPTQSTPLGISFLEEMIKHSTLLQEYRMQVAKMRHVIQSKEAIIQQLEKEVGSAKKIKVPEIGLYCKQSNR